ncbi:hypothetical protein [Hyunsoonleella pacifica]|uniref:PL28 ulvan lyase domain-containing protein n=1 Tax=Hyunsoonleella pacifica TaxID=1080224 RepID=A0A4Q9FV59_9FLAO|nr:hypothetical protein [Hyunsoonleella pacifica]TBN19109.1 hypothetical protein EYD46_03325 [Hyunsoonleella pacifica]GGD07384.1 hypothetical protein GCM10011368_06630 [Hyunsoonleella pacifica]
MKNLLNLMNLKMLMIIALLAVVMSCSNEEQEVFQEDLNEIQDPENSDLSAVCSFGNTKYTYSGPGNDVNEAVDDEIDDRSCPYNYAQTTNGTPHTWGSYRLRAGTSTDNLQPRIERASKVVKNVKVGNFIEIKGTVRIKRVGDGDSTSTNGELGNSNGTYLIQAKGKHSTPDGEPVVGSADPAICLFVAKPIEENGIQYYDIYREQITERGGSGSGGRTLFGPITRVRQNRDFDITVKTGFDVSGGEFRHYVNSTINGVFRSFRVPNPDRALQAKLRMGAYRCKGGEAEILWRDVTTRFVNNP